MVKYKDNISRARAQLEEAQTNLVEAYLTRIREGYQTLEPRQKEFVLGGLDALVNNIENGSFTEQSTPNSSSRESKRKNLAYDSEVARKIREDLGWTREKLIEELGLSRGGYSQIGNYESGKINPSKPPRGKTSVAYMNWLKEQGYNPFNL
jgi:DNA-binding XRE family transcriptional regulator|tara:strand:+ start:131 stop:583 length:453 start_codon:yes stop_codon:yes gene_type:complete